MTRVVLALSLVLLTSVLVESKIFTPCELAVELARSKYNVSFWQIPTWVCLAHHATGFNSSYNEMGYVGIFRLSRSAWCTECGVTCDDFLDDYIEDDINCAVNVVYQKHHGSLDGFSAWGTYYNAYCREPWKDLQTHDCHQIWRLLILKIPKPIPYPGDASSSTGPESTDHTDHTSSDEPPTVAPGTLEYWAVHHVIFSDAGLMIIFLLIILVVAGIVEIWRRRELPLAQFCMNA